MPRQWWEEENPKSDMYDVYSETEEEPSWTLTDDIETARAAKKEGRRVGFISDEDEGVVRQREGFDQVTQTDRMPQKPSDDELNINDLWMKHQPDVKRIYDEAFKGGIEEYKSNFGNPDIALMKPQQINALKEKGMAYAKGKADKEVSDYRKVFWTTVSAQQAERKAEMSAERAANAKKNEFEAQSGMVSDNDKKQMFEYVERTGKYPPEFNKLFRVPGAQLEIIKYVNDQLEAKKATGGNRAETEINWKTLEKASQTANNPTFQRMIKAGKILIEGSTDPNTGRKNEAELDKIVRLRNEIPDGVFGQLSNKLRAFNSWDQFVKYQVSDPKMAELKGTVIANAERLGAIYSGGGTVTSDQKIKLAIELLDVKLGKQGFSQLVNSHKDSIRNTIGEYQTIRQVSPFGDTQSQQGKSAVTVVERRKTKRRTSFNKVFGREHKIMPNIAEEWNSATPIDDKESEWENAVPISQEEWDSASPVEPKEKTFMQKTAPYVRPVLEFGGMIGGGIAGTPASPAGTIAGAGIGYMAGREAADLYDEAVGLKEPDDLMTERGALNQVSKSGQEFVEGTGMEAGGILIGKGIGAATRYATSKLPEKLYGSAIKLPTSEKWTKVLPSKEISRRGEAIRVGLENKITPSEYGLNKITNLEREARQAVDDIIDVGTARGDTVKTKNIIDKGLQKAYSRAAESSDPEGAKALIDEIAEKFRAHGDTIPTSKLNQIKRQLYDEVKWGGTESTALASQLNTMGKKGIAHEAMLSLEELYPAIKSLNKQDAAYIALKEGIERATARMNNQDIVGLGAKVIGVRSIPTAILEWTIGHPQVKSRLAFALKSLGGNAGKAFQSVAVRNAEINRLRSELNVVESKIKDNDLIWQTAKNQGKVNQGYITKHNRQSQALLKKQAELKNQINVNEDFISDLTIVEKEAGLRPDQRAALGKKDWSTTEGADIGSPLINRQPSNARSVIPERPPLVEGGGVTDEIIQRPVEYGRTTRRDIGGENSILTKVPEESFTQPSPLIRRKIEFVKSSTPQQLKSINSGVDVRPISEINQEIAAVQRELSVSNAFEQQRLNEYKRMLEQERELSKIGSPLIRRGFSPVGGKPPNLADMHRFLNNKTKGGF